MPSVHYCAFCHGPVPTIDGMKRHYARKAECRKKFQAEIGKSIVTIFDDEIPDPPQPAPTPEALPSDEGSQPDDIDIPIAGDDFIPGRTHSRSPTADENSPGQRSKRAWVEEAEDEDAPEVKRYTQEYPGRVADTIGTEKTKFEKIREDQKMEGLEPEAPFADEEEWELVKWLMKNVGQTKADDFLKIPIVSILLLNL
jgi:hypothetical protein